MRNRQRQPSAQRPPRAAVRVCGRPGGGIPARLMPSPVEGCSPGGRPLPAAAPRLERPPTLMQPRAAASSGGLNSGRNTA